MKANILGMAPRPSPSGNTRTGNSQRLGAILFKTYHVFINFTPLLYQIEIFERIIVLIRKIKILYITKMEDENRLIGRRQSETKIQTKQFYICKKHLSCQSKHCTKVADLASGKKQKRLFVSIGVISRCRVSNTESVSVDFFADRLVHVSGYTKSTFRVP